MRGDILMAFDVKTPDDDLFRAIVVEGDTYEVHTNRLGKMELDTIISVSDLLHPEQDFDEWTIVPAHSPIRDFNPHHEPAGTPIGGRFAGGPEVTGTSELSGEVNSAALSKVFNPGDLAKFKKLKEKWSTINNALLEFVDVPNDPAAKVLADQLKDVVKQMYRLRADPGGIEGIGLPGGPRDVVIVGGGPGGLAAATTGGIDNLDTLLIEASDKLGGQAKQSSRVENYPGFPIGVSGERLTTSMIEQAERTGTDIKTGVRVTGLFYDADTGMKTLTLANGEEIEARTVVLAGGLEFRKMDFTGSDGNNVIYGDGAELGKLTGSGNAIVVGGSNGAAQAALGVARTAKHVTVLSRSLIGESMSGTQADALRNHPKITVLEQDEIAILQRDPGTGYPTQLVTKKGTSIPVTAVGLFIGSVPNTSWLPKEIARDKTGKIGTDGDLITGMPGVFAIGDIRIGGMGRIGAAVGEGLVAMRNTFTYIEEMKERAAKEKPVKDAKAAERRYEVTNKNWDKIVDQLFLLDEKHPYFGQTIEPKRR